MYATYRREYKNFTHLPGESIDALFQRFTVVVNNMRANVDVLPYDDHDRAVKLLHSLDRMIWGGKFEAIVESEKYDTLTVNELFSKLKSAEVDRGIVTPRFLITIINTNDRISRVKPVKPRSNLGQPGSSPENLANEPQWIP
jgi:hypothetical protein